MTRMKCPHGIFERLTLLCKFATEIKNQNSNIKSITTMKPFRKLVILLLSVSCSIMAYAQKEYDSLLKEGKVWTMSYKATLNPEVYPDLYHYSKMMLHGDTLISEIPFKQIYEKGLTDNLEDESAEWKATRQFVGEKDGRIFYLNGDYSVNPIGVMDFSLNVSDVFDGDKNEKQKQFILALKDFAMEEQVHVILVAHPRKSVAFLRKTDISGSGDIINAVDNCFIFHRVNEDFIHAITDFYDAARASQLRQYGNVLAVEKNRLRGVVDLMVGMQYEIESRRFKNYIDEDIHYDWENIGTQQTFQSTLDRSINTLQNTFGGMEVVDNNQPFGSPQLDNCPF